jgi:hypothetical protein
MAPAIRANVLSYTSGDGSTLLHAAVAPKPEMADVSELARRRFSPGYSNP